MICDIFCTEFLQNLADLEAGDSELSNCTFLLQKYLCHPKDPAFSPSAWGSP
jgi:hypothetical protein